MDRYISRRKKVSSKVGKRKTSYKRRRVRSVVKKPNTEYKKGKYVDKRPTCNCGS